MKKLITLSLIAGSLAMFGIAYGAVDVVGCMDKNAYNYDVLATIADNSCRYHGNGDPMKATQVFDNLIGYQLPIVSCNLFGILGNKCFDVSGTQYFKVRQNPIGIAWLGFNSPFGLAFNGR